MNSKYFIPLLIICMNGLFALTFPIGKLALAWADTWWLTAGRMLIAGICFLLASRGIAHQVPTARQWLVLAYTSIWYVVLAYVPEFWALTYVSPFKTNMLWSMQPFIAVLMDGYYHSIWPNRWQACALVLGSVSLMPLFLSQDYVQDPLEWCPPYLLPELALMVAVVATLYGWVLIKRLRAQDMSLITINGYTMTMGGTMCAILAIMRTWYVGHTLPVSWAMAGMYAGCLAVIGNIMGYALYGYLLQEVSLGFLSFTGFLCPLWGLLFALLQGESIYVGQMIALAGVITSLAWYYCASSET